MIFEEIIAQLLLNSNAQYQLGAKDIPAGCFADDKIARLAHLAFDQVSQEDRDHCVTCLRCAALYVRLRRLYLINPLRDDVRVVLSGATHDQVLHDDSIRIVGRISLESLDFHETSDGAEWVSHPLYMRVVVIVDFDLNLLSATLLDAPEELEEVSIQGPTGWSQLVADDAEDLFDIDEFFEPKEILNESFRSPASFSRYVNDGRLRICLGFSNSAAVEPPAVTDVAELLHRMRAIEYGTYLLPNGLRTDTHVNVGKLCESPFAIRRLDSAIDAEFQHLDFDTIIVHGWAMEIIGRRLAFRRRESRTAIGEVVVCLGYDPPRPMADIPHGANVLILVDVVVTGKLVQDLEFLVSRSGANVVGVGAIASSPPANLPRRRELQSLCQIDMRLQEDDINLAMDEDEWVYNPCSCAITKRANESRSPSEFLRQEEHVARFWQLVNDADALEPHRQEGNAHYRDFIDTLKIFQSKHGGKALLEPFQELIRQNFTLPQIIIVPRAPDGRSRTLGERVAKELAGAHAPRVLVSSRRSGRWEFSEDEKRAIFGSRVLIVDIALGHGKTVEELAETLVALHASGIGAAALISRMPASAERALDRRLSDGCVALVRVETQPVYVIHSSGESVCPHCAEQAVANAARDWDGDNISRLSETMARVPIMRTASGRRCTASDTPDPLRKLSASPSDKLLSNCSPQVAAAVTLHSLNAAKVNGMASLALPELQDPSLNPRTCAAMVEHLPPGVVVWSGDVLEQELREVLATTVDLNLWQATAKVMAREGLWQWQTHLPGFLERCQRLKDEPCSEFWGQMVSNAYLAVLICRDHTEELNDTLSKLSVTYRDSPARHGLNCMRCVLANRGKL